MSRFHSYINSAKTLLAGYNGEEPLSANLKKFFAAHKKFGSRDRKTISHICYCYFRLGKSLPLLEIEERIVVGLFLCSNQPSDLLGTLHPVWNEQVILSFDEKIEIIEKAYEHRNEDPILKSVFPWKDQLEKFVDAELLNRSLFIQPDLFLRIRPGKHKQVAEKLNKAKISFKTIDEYGLRIPNGVKIDDVLAINKEVIVQDWNSQRVGQLLDTYANLEFGNTAAVTADLYAWDCCAASGGKSIMLHDRFPGLKLTVSDIRESILVNLRKRFAEAGIQHFNSLVLDLAKHAPSKKQLPHDFPLIIADVPCTGSGTWSRTPEQLHFFNETRIDDYAALQKQIVTNAITRLQPGGFLLYITCSVFRKENSDIIDYLTTDLHMEAKEVTTITGYETAADSMFAALLQKKS